MAEQLSGKWARTCPSQPGDSHGVDNTGMFIWSCAQEKFEVSETVSSVMYLRLSVQGIVLFSFLHFFRPVEDTELFVESLAAECSSNSLSFRWAVFPVHS